MQKQPIQTSPVNFKRLFNLITSDGSDNGNFDLHEERLNVINNFATANDVKKRNFMARVLIAIAQTIPPNTTNNKRPVRNVIGILDGLAKIEKEHPEIVTEDYEQAASRLKSRLLNIGRSNVEELDATNRYQTLHHLLTHAHNPTQISAIKSAINSTMLDLPHEELLAIAIKTDDLDFIREEISSNSDHKARATMDFIQSKQNITFSSINALLNEAMLSLSEYPEDQRYDIYKELETLAPNKGEQFYPVTLNGDFLMQFPTPAERFSILTETTAAMKNLARRLRDCHPSNIPDSITSIEQNAARAWDLAVKTLQTMPSDKDTLDRVFEIYDLSNADSEALNNIILSAIEAEDPKDQIDMIHEIAKNKMRSATKEIHLATALIAQTRRAIDMIDPQEPEEYVEGNKNTKTIAAIKARQINFALAQTAQMDHALMKKSTNILLADFETTPPSEKFETAKKIVKGSNAPAPLPLIERAEEYILTEFENFSAEEKAGKFFQLLSIDDYRSPSEFSTALILKFLDDLPKLPLEEQIETLEALHQNGRHPRETFAGFEKNTPLYEAVNKAVLNVVSISDHEDSSVEFGLFQLSAKINKLTDDGLKQAIGAKLLAEVQEVPLDSREGVLKKLQTSQTFNYFSSAVQPEVKMALDEFSAYHTNDDLEEMNGPAFLDKIARLG